LVAVFGTSVIGSSGSASGGVCGFSTALAFTGLVPFNAARVEVAGLAVAMFLDADATFCVFVGGSLAALEVAARFARTTGCLGIASSSLDAITAALFGLGGPASFDSLAKTVVFTASGIFSLLVCVAATTLLAFDSTTDLALVVPSSLAFTLDPALDPAREVGLAGLASGFGFAVAVVIVGVVVLVVFCFVPSSLDFGFSREVAVPERAEGRFAGSVGESDLEFARCERVSTILSKVDVGLVVEKAGMGRSVGWCVVLTSFMM
jgi:hypothetical protein